MNDTSPADDHNDLDHRHVLIKDDPWESDDQADWIFKNFLTEDIFFVSLLFPKNVKEYKLEYCVFTIKEDIVCCYPRRYLICILCNIIFRKLDLVIDQVPNPGLGMFSCAPTFELSQKKVNFGQKNVESLIHLVFYPIFGKIQDMYYPKFDFNYPIHH